MIFVQTAAIATLALCLTIPAAAQTVIGIPIYDSASKSYFAIVDGHGHKTRHYNDGFVWHDAIDDARKRLFRGVPGRVATITNIDTYEFLLKTFQIKEDTWIGYRYMCQAQQIRDSMNHTVPKGAFMAWDNPWKQDIYACAINQYTHDYATHDISSAEAYAPIAIHPIAQGFRMFAKGPDKGYMNYIIEWPTGGP